MDNKGQSGRPDDCKGRWNVDSLHAHFERWLLNLEKYYDSRLTEIKEATATAFAANKESVLKAETSQREYNQQHNDLSRKMEAQAARFVDEKQLKAELESIKGDIARLQEHSAVGAGRLGQQQESRQTVQWGVGQAIAIALVIAGFVVALIEVLLKTVKP